MSTIQQIIGEVESHDIVLYVEDGQLAYVSERGGFPSELKVRLQERRDEIIDFLLSAQIDGGETARQRPIPQANRSQPLPLSFAQQRLWFIDQMNGGSPQYNMANAYRFEGEFDEEAAQQALGRIINRHESLRTVFISSEEGEEQFVRNDAEFVLTRIDLSHVEPAEQAAHVERLADEDARKPFDLSRDLMLRCSCISLHRRGKLITRGVLLFNMHHIASDAWSMGILVREFVAQYEAIVSGKSALLEPLEIQYADYAAWQREWLNGQRLSQQLDYWEAQLSGIPQVHSLRLDSHRPEIQTFNGADHALLIDGATVDKLKRIAVAHQATLFMVLHGAFALLLSRLSGCDDIVIGTPVANRQRDELKPLIGFFVNTVALRADCQSNLPFTDYLSHIRIVNLDAQQHQDVPFEVLVERLRVPRSTSHAPVFQIVFSMDTTEASQAQLSSLSLTPLERPYVSAKFELTLNVRNFDGGLLFHFEYNTDLFQARSIEQLAGCFETLLKGIAADAGQRIHEIPLLTQEECESLIAEASTARASFEPASCIHQWFESQAQRNPAAPAALFEDEVLSYGELNARANRLAHCLIEQGVGPDVLVGLCAERSLELVIGILGILKAGGAYLPLDPSYPEERLRCMLEDSGVDLVVTQRPLAQRLPLGKARALLLEDGFAGYSETNPQVADLEPSHLAYVIYTSGSTGQPKGVMVEHRQVARLLLATEADFGFGPDDVWTLFHSYAFDFSVWELWGALAYGGRLVVVPHEVSRTPEAFYELLASQGVTVLNQTPTAFAQLSAVDGQLGKSLALRAVIFGGEALKLSELAGWVSRRGDETPQLINMYGITETTVHVTYRRILKEDIEAGQGSVIGRPLDDLRMYVLDEHLAVVPAGTAGELFVGGGGVARGYLHRGQLTAQRFIADPYLAGGRLYRTGDVARYLPSGEFEYAGRADNQVKIRGFRIELGEIEHRLSALEGVQGSAVLLRQEDSGDKRLVAYVALGEVLGRLTDEQRQELIGFFREGLAAQLPSYMVPAAYVLLESLPLTANGKVDRKSLPAPDGESVQREAYQAPRDELEAQLCAVWAEVLGLEQVGIRDNFFNIGGDSILSIRIVSLLERRGISVNVKELFQHQTVAALAGHVKGRIDGRTEAVDVEAFYLLSSQERERVGDGYADVYPLSALQAGMVFHTQLEGFSGVYHDMTAEHIKCAWDQTCFEQALGWCIERHPILRTGFDLSGERPLQHVHQSVPLPLQVEDLRELNAAEQDAHIEKWIEARQRHEFNWSAGPLFQVNIFRRSEESFEFVLSFHHAVLDGWSRAALSTQLHGAYQRLLAGDSLEAAQPDWTYRHFIAQEQAALADPEAQGYFAAMLAEAPMQQLPRLKPTAEENGQRRQARYPLEGLTAHSEGLFGLARQLGVPVQTLLLAVHFKVLSALSGEPVALSTVTHNGRPERADAERSLGLYLNSVPLALEPGEGSWAELIERVAQANTRSMAHRLYPLSVIQKEVGRTFSEVTFNYTHFHVFKEIGPDAELEVLGARGFEQTNFDFHVDVARALGVEELYLVINYDTALYEPAWIERIGGYYLQAVEQMLADPQAMHADCSLLPAEERDRLLEWGTGADIPLLDANAADLLARGLAIDPQATAARCGELALSCGELEARANRLANYLQEADLGQGARVGIYLERSLEQLVAVLGVLKSGASYVPLDVESPLKRVQGMLSDAEVELVLLCSADLERLPLGGVDVLLMDGAGSDADWLGEFDASAPEIDLGPDSEAYLLYTSGSTGQPKGVQVSHRGLVNYLAHAAGSYFDEEIAGAVVSTPLCFDATLTTLLAPLCAGNPVELIEEREGWLERLADRLFGSEEGLLFKLTPAHLDALSLYAPADPNPVRHRLVVGGEQFSVERLLAYKRGALPRTRFVNEYGPTETVVGCSVYEVDGLDEALSSRTAVPIGVPIANTGLYVLGADGGLSPAGSLGELCIGGAGVALGYANRAELTESRFVPDPFAGTGRIYRTGDRVRWLEDGNLEFVGRSDDQVKLRGYRVELGEVESALRACDGVREAAAVLREGRLVAYLAGEGGASYSRIEGYRTALAERLPEYMVPSAFVHMESLPLTANGKVDRQALPEPDGSAVAAAEYEPPRNDLEERLCEVWAEVLGLERVGIRDSFFSIGGDSILSIRVVALLKAEGISLGVQDLFRHQNVAELASHIESGTVSGDQLLEVAPFSLLNGQERARAQAGGYQDAYPLSALQAGMVFHTQLAQFSGIYHDVNSEHIKCPWDQACFEQALSACIEHHPILRTGFDLDGDRALQFVHASFELPLVVEDIRDLTAEAQDAHLAEWLEARRRHVFDWSRGPLFQINIFLRSQESFEFAISFHHSILDGWSRAALTTELYKNYERLLAGQPLDTPQPDWTYRNFVALEQAAIAGSEARDFFATMLAEAPEQQLPRYGQPKRTAGESQPRQAGTLAEGFDALSGDILNLAKRLGVPVQAVLLAAHFKVLSALNGQAKVMSCLTSNGRPEQGSGDRGLGLFLNSVPLALELQPGSWQSLIEQVSELHARSLAHRRYPLSQIQQDLGRTYSEVLFNYMHFHVYDEVLDSQLEVEVLGSSGFEQTNFDFTVDFARGLGADEMLLSFSYNADLFPEELVERIGAYYRQAFQSMLADPQAPHQNCLLLTGEESRLLAEWNQTEAEFPQLCIHQLFEAQVARDASAPALEFEGQSLSYGQLNARANQVAHFLIERGVGPDVLVGLCAERSLEMVAGVLGILKAGGAYLPLDPSYPEARLGYMLEDSAAGLVLTQRAVLDRLPRLQAQAVPLDELETFAGYPESNPQVEDLTPSNLAYVIYTSGSTGEPKGVMVEQRGVVNYLNYAARNYLNAKHAGAVMSSPLSFDATVTTLLTPWVCGKRLVVLGEDDEALLQGLERYLYEDGGNWLFKLTPAHLQWLSNHESATASHPAAEHTVVLGGEQLRRDIVWGWKARRLPASSFINEYGPTETVVGCSTYRVQTLSDLEVLPSAVPIGRAIDNTRLHVLNARGEPVPLGVIGELHIGGAGVARGYLNRADLSQERFVAGDAGRRYKTGDLVRWLPDGTLEFIGRSDDQVKIRGFRIELGEIEAQLMKLAQVRSAAVVARQQAPGEKRLVGYVTLSQAGDEAEVSGRLRSELRRVLPEHMVPGAILVLDELPLTANGKVDRAALPAADRQTLAMPEYLAPRNETEQALCEIWHTVLKVERVGVNDNFFALGGDSILSMLVVSRANQAGIGITTRDVFLHQSVAELALTADRTSDQERPQGPVEGELALLPIQQALFDGQGGSLHHYNQALLLVTPAQFDEDALRESVNALLQRHDAFRLRFESRAQGWHAQHAEFSQSMVEAVCAVETLPPDGPEQSRLLTQRCEHYQRSLNIAEGPLLRAVYFRHPQGLAGRLLLVVHHLVMDGVSWRLLLSDLEQGYTQWQAGQSIWLAPKSSSYQQWGAALSEYAHSDQLQSELVYWRRQVETDGHSSSKLDLTVSPAPYGSTATVEVRLTQEQTTALLKGAGAAYRTRTQELLLAGICLGMRRWSGQDALQVTMEGHGRDEALFPSLDTTQTIGWLTTTYPLTIRSQGAHVSQIIKAVKEQLRAVPHNGIGYGLLRHGLQDPNLMAAQQGRLQPLVFNYLGQFEQEAQSSTFEVASENAGPVVDPERLREHLLGLNGMVAGGVLGFSLDYSRHHFETSAMQALAHEIEAGLQAVIEHCMGIGQGAFTPSDFPNAQVDDKQLDLWQSEYALHNLYRATPMQQGMFFHSLLDRGAYVAQIFPTLEGELDETLLRRAWERTIARYDIFRTAFVGEGGALHQLVVKDAQLPWHEEDWRDLSEAEQASRFEAYRAQDRLRGFELSRPPLQRIAIFRLGEKRYQLLWSHHHMQLDGWCTPLVYRDVMQTYYGLLAGEPVELPPVVPYERYVEWLYSQDEAAARDYWSGYLSSVETPSLLSQAKAAVAATKHTLELSLGREETERLQAFAKSNQTTLNALLQLAWGLVLRRYCDTDEVLFGTVVSGRPAQLPGMESMVGLFINTLPVKVSFSQSTDIKQLSRDLGLAFQESVDHGHLPLAEIHRQSRIEGGAPLFDSLLVLENYPLDSALDVEAGSNQLQIDRMGADTRDTYELTLSVIEQEQLAVLCEYASEAFTESFVAQLLRHFEAALRQLPIARSIDEIELITSAERDQVLEWGKGPEVPLLEENALDLLAGGFAIDPQATAVRCGENALSYGQLESQANRLANYLQEAGLEEGARVGIYLERSLAQLVAVLGVLKSGASYVPLDVESPVARVQGMLSDSQVELVLLRSADLERLPLGGVDVLLMDEAGSSADWLNEFDDSPSQLQLGPESEAYVLYTSGSTGKPKGVQVSHGGLVNYLAHAAGQYFDEEIAGAVVSTPLYFDATLTTLLAPLCAGQPVELIEEGEGWLERLADRLFNSDQALLFKLTPAHLDALALYAPAEPNPVRHRLVVGGEQFGVERLLAYKRGALPRARFVNEYGPTETVVGCSVHEVDELDEDLSSRAAVPIGLPIANTRLYVVAADGGFSPPGSVGELCIGGAGVALGYVNGGEQNQTRFVPDPYAGTGRIYRTGDRVRWLSGGVLEYVGRRDDQVKLRGYRVELGEVESALRACAGVREAAVVLRQGRLAAYVVAQGEASSSRIEGYRTALGERLPEYMVPAFFVQLEALPLTANGKVDRSALPAPDGSAVAAAEYKAPRSELESQLCAVWAEVLGLEQVGIQDNFFAVGGDSILSIRVVALLKDQGAALEITDIFESQTIERLAVLIEQRAQESAALTQREQLRRQSLIDKGQSKRKRVAI